jgi:hypothetical protein
VRKFQLELALDRRPLRVSFASGRRPRDLTSSGSMDIGIRSEATTNGIPDIGAVPPTPGHIGWRPTMTVKSSTTAIGMATAATLITIIGGIVIATGITTGTNWSS